MEDTVRMSNPTQPVYSKAGLAALGLVVLAWCALSAFWYWYLRQDGDTTYPAIVLLSGPAIALVRLGNIPRPDGFGHPLLVYTVSSVLVVGSAFLAARSPSNRAAWWIFCGFVWFATSLWHFVTGF